MNFALSTRASWLRVFFDLESIFVRCNHGVTRELLLLILYNFPNFRAQKSNADNSLI